MTANNHNELLASAAKAILRPLGCAQKGRSRIWLDDHGWWVGVIEFQPSNWAKGTYLNVGASWLWSGKDFLSFDDGYRVEPFHEFTGTDQFEGSAQFVAERAKEEVLNLRRRFCTVESTAVHLRDKVVKDVDIWGHYHAGVSSGIAGWGSDARRRLAAALSVKEREAEWVDALKSRCTNLLALVDDQASFKACVAELVAKDRAALKLPKLAEGWDF